MSPKKSQTKLNYSDRLRESGNRGDEPDKDEWETPQWLYDKLDAIFKFELDPCATAENAKCPRFYTEEQNGLEKRWFGKCFVNPPYSGKFWMRKAYHESQKDGCDVVVLVPSKTETIAMHSYGFKADYFLFLKSRLTFEKNGISFESPALFSSMLVIFSKLDTKQKIKLSELGVLLELVKI